MSDILEKFDDTGGDRKRPSDINFIVAPDYNETLTLKVSTPTKRALKAVAGRVGFSVSDLVRHLMNTYMDTLYPGYGDLFYKFYCEETQTPDVTSRTWKDKTEEE